MRKEGIELRAPDHWALRAMMDDATKAIYDEVLELVTYDDRKPGKVLRRALIELRERLLIQKRRKRRTGAKEANSEPTIEQPFTEQPRPEQPLAAQPSTESPPTDSSAPASGDYIDLAQSLSRRARLRPAQCRVRDRVLTN